MGSEPTRLHDALATVASGSDSPATIPVGWADLATLRAGSSSGDPLQDRHRSALGGPRPGQRARSNLIGQGSPLIEDPSGLVAARLGQVVAARLVADNFSYLPGLGADLLAMGVRATAGNPDSEILCAIDASSETVDEQADAMDSAFAADATDAVTGEPMRDLVSGFEVDRLDEGDLHAARAELDLAPENEPGFLFRAFVRGSALTYVGLPEPFSPE